MSFFDWIKKHKKLLLTILLLTVLILIGRFLLAIDFASLKEYLEEAPMMFVGVIFASFCAYIISTAGWILCIDNNGKRLGFWRFFVYRHVGEILSVFNPTGFVAGESLKTVFLTKHGIPVKNALSSVLLQRLLVILSGLFLALTSFVIISLKELKSSSAGMITLSVIVVIGGVWLGYLLIRLLVHPKIFIGKGLKKLKQKHNWAILTDNIVNSALEMNIEAARFFAHSKVRFLGALLLFVVHWIFGALEFYIILRSLGMGISVVKAIIIEMGVVIFKIMGTIIPGQLGVEEYGNKVMLDLVGVSSNEIWLVASLMRRARQLFWLIIAGIFTLFVSDTLKEEKKKHDE